MTNDFLGPRRWVGARVSLAYSTATIKRLIPWEVQGSVVDTTQWVNWTVPYLKDLPLDGGIDAAREGGAEGGSAMRSMRETSAPVDAAVEASPDGGGDGRHGRHGST
jgi:hypothetical protein